MDRRYYENKRRGQRESVRTLGENDVAACVKHFALNNQERNRLWVNVQVSERAHREIYLPAFYAAVTEGEALTLMGAYNLVKCL